MVAGSGIPDRTVPHWCFSNFLRRRLVRPERLLDFCGPKAEDVVADLGGGGGFFLSELTRRIGPSGRIYEVDIDESALSVAREAARALGVFDHVEFVRASAASIPSIPSAGVDYVLAHGLLCCLRDKEGAVREMGRILKPGGRALVTFVTIGPRWTARGRALRLSDGRFEGLIAGHSWELTRGRRGPFSRRFILKKPEAVTTSESPDHGHALVR